MAVLKVFSVLEKKLDACQQWCLRRLLRIFHLQRVTNTEVLRRTNQTQLSTVLCDRRLRLFGHVARSDAWMNHSRALRAYYRVTESLEASSRPTQTVMDANHWERSECTQHRSAHGMEMSSGSWTTATNRGSGYAPTWCSISMMTMMFSKYWRTQCTRGLFPHVMRYTSPRFTLHYIPCLAALDSHYNDMTRLVADTTDHLDMSRWSRFLVTSSCGLKSRRDARIKSVTSSRHACCGETCDKLWRVVVYCWCFKVKRGHMSSYMQEPWITGLV